MTKYENETVENRINAVGDLKVIIAIAESQIDRSRNIPVLDDARHADWVQGYADRIHEIRLDMEDLVSFGHLKGDCE